MSVSHDQYVISVLIFLPKFINMYKMKQRQEVWCEFGWEREEGIVK